MQVPVSMTTQRAAARADRPRMVSGQLTTAFPLPLQCTLLQELRRPLGAANVIPILLSVVRITRGRI